jgi:hypothetical protein
MTVRIQLDHAIDRVLKQRAALFSRPLLLRRIVPASGMRTALMFFFNFFRADLGNNVTLEGEEAWGEKG